MKHAQQHPRLMRSARALGNKLAFTMLETEHASTP
jgi:hypothetical protein